MYEELIYVLLMVIYVLKINIFDPNSASYRTSKVILKEIRVHLTYLTV